MVSVFFYHNNIYTWLPHAVENCFSTRQDITKYWNQLLNDGYGFDTSLVVR